MYKVKNCERCGHLFHSNQMIKDDNICQNCNFLNCITYWYPLLKFLKFPMPETIIIHDCNVNLIELLDCKIPAGFNSRFINKIIDAIKMVGLPAFLRTGYLSNKHDWKDSCYIQSIDYNYLVSHIKNIVEMSAMATIDRMEPIEFWAVRKFIKTEPYFYYFNEMPITKERRYFIRNRKIECHHNYWVREAFGNDIDEHAFKEMSKLNKKDEKTLNQMAQFVANLFNGYWSIDFLKDKEGDWYLTDMAIGEMSYHPKHKK